MEIWFNGIYSRNNLPAAKDAPYVINPNKYANIGNTFVAIYFKDSNATQFDSLGIGYNSKDINISIENIKSIVFGI